MRSEQIGPVLWLVAFVGSGIGLGQTFELLQLHAGPARCQVATARREVWCAAVRASQL